MARFNKVWQAIETEILHNKAYLQPGYGTADLAAACDIDVRDVSVVIRLRRACNFATFLQQLRVRSACQMLLHKDNAELSCEQVGRKCGFASRQSMHNAFVRQLGMTPQEYRTKNNNNKDEN